MVLLRRTTGNGGGGVAVLRGVVALALLLAALRLFLPPYPVAFPGMAWVWFGLAGGLGVVLARPWALPLALLPLAGWWYVAANGLESRDEPDPLFWLNWTVRALVVLLGGAGIALGLGGRRALAGRLTATTPSARRALERTLSLAALLLVIGAATLDWSRGGVFLSRPRAVEARRYNDDMVRAAVAGLPFAVYGAPTSEGLPVGVGRGALAPPDLGPIETVGLLYCDSACHRNSHLQVQSAPPEYGRVPRVGGPVEAVAIDGVVWHLEASNAWADLGDAHVHIWAPDRATFERVAAGLRRVNR